MGVWRAERVKSAPLPGKCRRCGLPELRVEPCGRVKCAACERVRQRAPAAKRAASARREERLAVFPWQAEIDRMVSEAQACQLRAEALRAFGGDDPRCACCGDGHAPFLCVNHKAGDGAACRRGLFGRREAAGTPSYLWLSRHGWPKDGFQLLCHNCNRAKHWLGVCPHQSGPNPHLGMVEAKERTPGQVRLKRRVLAAYGGEVCACCWEHVEVFLSVDFLRGGGTQHCLALRENGQEFYRWLVRQGFPPGFQVLCHNCNFAKHTCGRCPHHGAAE